VVIAVSRVKISQGYSGAHAIQSELTCPIYRTYDFDAGGDIVENIASLEWRVIVRTVPNRRRDDFFVCLLPE
jgi:hypothetical protein